jgi:hypothetical protein
VAEERGKRSRRRELALNLALLSGAFAFAALALEVGVRLFVDLREHQPIAVHGVDPANPIAFLPGHTQVYETEEFRYRVSFNRFGRRDVEWTDAAIADPANVLFIGDSFVLGNGVEHEATIPTRLEEGFAAAGRPREVFNFGMPGGNPRTYALLLDDALASGFDAGTILVGIFVGNDFYPSTLAEPAAPRLAATPPPPRHWRPRSQLFQFVKLRVSQSPRFLGWALTAGRLLGITLYDSAGSHVFLRRPTAKQEELFQMILSFLGSMQDASRESGRWLAFVIFPNKIQVENRRDLTGDVFDAARPNQQILAYCETRGIPCLDLLPVLSREYERGGRLLYYPVDRHLNERGTLVAGEAILEFLRRNEP